MSLVKNNMSVRWLIGIHWLAGQPQKKLNLKKLP